MGQSAGAGSPVYFICPIARKNRWRAERGRYSVTLGHKKITRTGKVKPTPKRQGSALGVRSLYESHQYLCECGHLGWTNHRSILRYPIEGEV